MVNQNLKEQIEAAKSALARGESRSQQSQLANSEKTPPLAKPINIERQSNSTEIGKNDFTESGSITMDILLDRVKTLESQLVINQRDLQTLIKKIREITNRQKNTQLSRSTKTNSDKQHKPWSKIIATIAAVIFGGLIGAIYFFGIGSVTVVFQEWFYWFQNTIADIQISLLG